MKRILVTGVSGFLGWYVAKLLQVNDYEVIGIYHNTPISLTGVKTVAADLSLLSQVPALIREYEPEAVIHLAALSSPNYCEIHPEESFLINVEVSEQLAIACNQSQIPLFFASSDLIFDGAKGDYDENAITNPVNLYGQHKVEAEKRIQDIHPKATILRLPLMYGLQQEANNFLKAWVAKLQSGQSIPAFQDEYRTPASGEDVARGILLLLKQQRTGIWHLGGQERLSRYEFAQLLTQTFQISNNLIKATFQADVKMPAARPADVSLDSKKAFSIGYRPLKIQESLQLMHHRI